MSVSFTSMRKCVLRRVLSSIVQALSYFYAWSLDHFPQGKPAATESRWPDCELTSRFSLCPHSWLFLRRRKKKEGEKKNNNNREKENKKKKEGGEEEEEGEKQRKQQQQQQQEGEQEGERRRGRERRRTTTRRTQNLELYHSRIEILGICLFLQSAPANLHAITYTTTVRTLTTMIQWWRWQW